MTYGEEPEWFHNPIILSHEATPRPAAQLFTPGEMASAVATARRHEDTDMPASICSLGLLAVVVALLGACATAEVRTARVTEVFTPS